jgi:hypothetical protein
MTLYKVLYKNYKLRKGELLGMLPEKRKNLRGESPSESGMRWARLVFGNLVKDKQAIFIVSKELTEASER